MSNMEKSKHHARMFNIENKTDRAEYCEICDMSAAGKALIVRNEHIKLTEEEGNSEGGFTKIEKLYIYLEWKTFKKPKTPSRPAFKDPNEINITDGKSPSSL